MSKYGTSSEWSEVPNTRTRHKDPRAVIFLQKCDGDGLIGTELRHNTSFYHDLGGVEIVWREGGNRIWDYKDQMRRK